jgi:hypothetical protein
MAYCEDYPCCGHTPSDPCDYRETGTVDYWHARMSQRDYDPYYDSSDY